MTNLKLLAERFALQFNGRAPHGICRAPGRVNIIGEHLDYNGLPVLPMTINRDIGIAFRTRKDHRVSVASDRDHYPLAEFDNCADIQPSPHGAWENYIKAAVQGINAHFRITSFPGIEMLVAGDIPTAAGLSSSSALVVASALAYLAVLDKSLDGDISRLELATLLAEAERYVGTQGGGMDQAVILLGGQGEACKIDFAPLRVERLPMISDHIFVLCDSLVVAEKTGAARLRYNEGPATCKLLRALVEKQTQEDFDEGIRLASLGELWFGDLCLTNAEAAELIERAIPGESVTPEAVAKRLGVHESSLNELFMGATPAPSGGYPLKARARHLLTEFARVEAARDAFLAQDAIALGELMNASHESCANDYGVSCPELDILVHVARKHGAIGARLTGAGFGGYTVNLLPSSILGGFIEGVRREYYEQYLKRNESDTPPDAIRIVDTAPAGDYLQAIPEHGS